MDISNSKVIFTIEKVSQFIYSRYYYSVLQDLGPAFAGGQYCVVSLEADAAPYMRLHFFVLFLAPVLICLGLMARVSCGLQVTIHPCDNNFR